MKKSNDHIFPILSLFSGGGFLDIGFMNQGFQVKEAVEINPHFIKAYNEGIANYIKGTNNHFISSKLVIHNKISKPKDLTKTEIHEELALQHINITGIIGGPPCQDFSLGGKHQGVNGERGVLIHHYFNMVKKVKPSFLFFENVPGLFINYEHNKSFLNLVNKIRRLGYSVWYEVLNSLEYTIPQDRKRIVIVAFKSHITKVLVKRGFTLEKNGEILKKTANDNFVFRWPKVHFENPKNNYDWPKRWPFDNKKKRYLNTNKLDDVKCLFVVNAFKGLNNKSPNQNEYFQPKSSKFNQIEEGDTNRKSFKRLHRYRYSPTVAYGNNEVHLHPTKARRLTIREGLRLQSVPDSYILPVDIPLTHKFKLISNGVPTRLAELIAKEIRRTLLLYQEAVLLDRVSRE